MTTKMTSDHADIIGPDSCAPTCSVAYRRGWRDAFSPRAGYISGVAVALREASEHPGYQPEIAADDYIAGLLQGLQALRTYPERCVVHPNAWCLGRMVRFSELSEDERRRYTEDALPVRIPAQRVYHGEPSYDDGRSWLFARAD